ncbi:MAG: hypothetical protein IT306_04465 [Chloroflexi bacterium]|nr:hypothetical protein [Chloroflexota bacterium]
MDERTADETAVEKTPRGSEAEAIVAAARPERIGVGSGDENVAKLQLAARWAEQFAPSGDDTLEAALARFKRAYHYVDSVTKLVEPDPA